MTSLPSRWYGTDSESYLLWRGSSETLSFFLPLARRALNTFRPSAVDILSLNPCLFLLFLFDGWKVLFISDFCFYYPENSDCKNTLFFSTSKRSSGLICKITLFRLTVVKVKVKVKEIMMMTGKPKSPLGLSLKRPRSLGTPVTLT